MGISKAYLLAYNVSQFCGWTYLMYRLLPYLRLQAKATTFFPAKNPASLYVELGDHVKLVLMAAILEIVHAAIGIVRSNPMTCAVQIARYVLIITMIIYLRNLTFLVGSHIHSNLFINGTQ